MDSYGQSTPQKLIPVLRISHYESEFTIPRGCADVRLTDDLVESFFSIVHPRFAMYDPVAIRARLAAPDTHQDGPLPHNLLAVAIAVGARFSDHPVISADRTACRDRDVRQYGEGKCPPRSRLVQMLVIRAREVVEVNKTHRIACLNNVQVLILAEAMCGRELSPCKLS